MGIDVGGTMVKAVVIDSDRSVCWRETRPTATEIFRDGSPTALVELVVDLYERASVTGAIPQAAGVAVPGLVDEEAGVARSAANLGWRDLPLRHLLEERLGFPVVLGHDVRAGGVAEGCFGAAQGVADYLFIAIGTGIAGSICLGGHVWAGNSWLAGELGHVVVEAGGDRCGCGGAGCLETVSSAAAIARRYAGRVGLQAGEVDAAQVLKLADRGDDEAREIVRRAVEALGSVLASTQSLLDVDLIVIGGGLARAGAPLLQAVDSALSSKLTFQVRPRLALAELGSEAGSLGAALLAQQGSGAGVQ